MSARSALSLQGKLEVSALEVLKAGGSGGQGSRKGAVSIPACLPAQGVALTSHALPRGQGWEYPPGQLGVNRMTSRYTRLQLSGRSWFISISFASPP